MGISLIKQFKKVDFPDPILPITATKSPAFKSKVIFERVAVDFSVILSDQ